MKTKKLRRSLQDSVIGGVSGGLGEYFDTDPVIFRILFVVLTLTGGGGVFIYLLMWIFIPKADQVYGAQQEFSQSTTNNQDKTTETKGTESEGSTSESSFNPLEEEGQETQVKKTNSKGNILGGTILIIIGLFFLADDFFPWFNWEYLWPIALVVAGLAIIKINYQPKK